MRRSALVALLKSHVLSYGTPNSRMLLSHQMSESANNVILNSHRGNRRLRKISVGGLLLRVVLILTMVSLPIGGLMAMADDVAYPVKDSVVPHHHQHPSQVDDSLDSAPGKNLPGSCAGHLAPCCSACISFYASSPLVLMPFSLFEIARWQRYSVPISVIVLPRDIRPPIA